MRLIGSAVAALLATASLAHAAPVLMISIDGLRPGDVLDADARGIKVPNLQRMAREGLAARGVRDALPSVTYPNHTTLVTGVWPARHRVAANTVFDPLQKDMGGWYWYAVDIQVPTLWDAVHAAGRPTASLGWPVTVGAASIDYDLPEYWRARDAEDVKLVRALTTPGLLETIQPAAHVTLAEMQDDQPADDVAKAKLAEAMLTLKRPAFFTLHLSSLDGQQHKYGPGAPQAHAALEAIDAEVGQIVASGRRAEPDLVVAIVSDHGFAPVEHNIELQTAFVQAGLITLGANGKPTAWRAEAWTSGGSAAVVLADPKDADLRAEVAALLAKLAADPASGINRVIDREAIAAMGGAPDADFFVDAKIGYSFGSKLTGPLVAPGEVKGTHGYFPDHPEMHATLILNGPGLPAHRDLGEVDMRDIAPTLAKVMHVPLPSADGKPLF